MKYVHKCSLAGMLIALTFHFSPAQADLASLPELSFSSMSEVIQNIQTARSMEISAWVLSPRGRMVRALRQAAQRGADVHVLLNGSTGRFTSNRLSLSELKNHGVSTKLSERPFHAKIAIIGDNLYLTDRNWASNGSHELIIHDSNAEDRQIARLAFREISGTNAHFSTRKRDALRLEAEVIRSCRSGHIDVETEAFTPGTIVEEALIHQAQQGAHVRLLVDAQEYYQSPRERRHLLRLSALGIQTHVGRYAEKLEACDNLAWMGSANTTPGVPDQIDWGIRLPPLTAPYVETEFERNWNAAYDPERYGSGS